MMISTEQAGKAKQVLRDKLESDVAAFLLKGGEIQECDFTDNRSWRDRMRKRSNQEYHADVNRSMFKAKQQRSPNPGATDNHHWRGKDANRTGSNGSAIAAIGLTI